MSNPKDYTVGWICALSTEYVAAQAFLDEKHEGPECVSSNDNNNYTLGKVGKHSVVIAVLPQGEYGISSAAGVAKDMLHSFPNVRVGLLVGIGGGAPSPKHDIRLGDIVVSAAGNGKGGVFQYDFGKMRQGQDFQDTGFLDQPPTVLRAAVNGLMAQYEIEGHRLEEAVDSILEKKPRLRLKYRRPQPNTDKLYQAVVIHPLNNSSSCAAVCGDDPSKLVPRPKRTEDEDNPMIHYGLIASANQLMKDAFVRDTLAAEKNVLCFEMEAAGLMNHFPCLVIRGICDYSDSHKNNEWQGHAAMTAAAYAKDLLCQIAPSRVEAEKKISDVLSSVEKDVIEMRCDVQDTRIDVKDLGLKRRREKIEHWLSPSDPSTNYNKALSQRQEGTGIWFSQRNEFAKWETQRNSFLWLCGIPGCGKTILSSTIIENLERTPARQPLIYFYFDFRDTCKQTLDSMVRSLVVQLSRKFEDTWKHLDILFSSCQDGGQQPTSESLCKVFFHMIEQVKEVWIVLDALDECSTRKGPWTEGLLSWMSEVLKSEHVSVHLLLTSRPEQDIKSGIREFADKDKVVLIQSSAISDDIRAYISTRVKREDNGLKRWQPHPAVQDEIEIRLMEKADGMFRWAACQLDVLETCLDYRTLQRALVSLPDTLDETYTRILCGIPEGHRQNATRLLQFLTYSERPLRIEEAVDALVVDTEQDEYFDPKYRMPDPREISCYCSSLVVVVYDEDDKPVEIQLAHFSVKDYLTSDRLDNGFAHNFEEVAAKASIATVCLAYLLHLDQNTQTEEISMTFPLAQYSARYWMDHAIVAEGKDKRLQGFVEKLFCHHENSFRNCYSLYQPDRPWQDDINEKRGGLASALYYASFGGLGNAVQYILSHGAKVNAQGGRYGNALSGASATGHLKIAELLIHHGAKVNAQGGYHGNALSAASAEGHLEIAELLIHHGAEVNAQGDNYGNALSAASAEGHLGIAELLIHHGAEVNAQGGYHGNALSGASATGYLEIAELLIHHGAEVNAQGGDHYGNALSGASAKGYLKIAELLIHHGAEVNAQGGDHGNALSGASARGHLKIAELLIHHGAEANAQGNGYYGNALSGASARGHLEIAELLIHHGAEVNAQGNGYYGNALSAAASAVGHLKIAELLIHHGAEVNAQGGDYDNALSAASARGYLEIAELLIHHGAEVNAQGNGYYGNALSAASAEGHLEIAELLIHHGAKVNAQGNGYHGNALSGASAEGHLEIAELLIHHGAEVNAHDGGYHGNALSGASAEGHLEIAELLIHHGAEVNAHDGGYGNALSAASAEGHLKIAELLIHHGAEGNAQGEGGDDDDGNALSASSAEGDG